MKNKPDRRREMVFRIIRKKKCLCIKEIYLEAEKRRIERCLVRQILENMLGRGVIYKPKPGVIELVD